MPVNLSAPDPSTLQPVAGLRLGVAEAGIRKANRKDLLVLHLDEGARVAGVFTRNRFCAAPVTVAREHLRKCDSRVRALVVNTGNANAGTGAEGLAAARATCEALAGLLHCAPAEVLPFSTGVIMEPLPVARVTAGLPQCIERLKAAGWGEAAEAIMTTDTLPKAASGRFRVGEQEITVTGIAKGAGMIEPNMATMLGFIASDAKVSAALVQQAVAYAASRSFNCISVDGDTSTNDSFMLIATGQAQMREITDAQSAEYQAFRAAVTDIATRLAQASSGMARARRSSSRCASRTAVTKWNAARWRMPSPILRS